MLSPVNHCNRAQHQHHGRTFMGRRIILCIWWDQKSLVYYELLKPGDSITGDRYLQLIRLSLALREKRNTSEDMIKLFFFVTTLGLMSLKS